MANSLMTSALYGITVSDEDKLHLIARVARRPSGIYYLIPRDSDAFQIDTEANWDPHASYHTDGTHHLKSFSELLLRPTKRQPLNGNFLGAEPLFAQSFQPGELTKHPVYSGAPAFADVFRIPADALNPAEPYTLAVDLLSPGASRLPGPWVAAVLEHSFRDAEPWIHATLWQGHSISMASDV